MRSRRGSPPGDAVERVVELVLRQLAFRGRPGERGRGRRNRARDAAPIPPVSATRVGSEPSFGLGLGRCLERPAIAGLAHVALRTSPGARRRCGRGRPRAGSPERPPAEVGGAGVVRVLEAPVQRGREALHLARAFSERAGKPAHHRIDYCESGNLAARENVRADRDRVGAEMIEDALVEAFEAR